MPACYCNGWLRRFSLCNDSSAMNHFLGLSSISRTVRTSPAGRWNSLFLSRSRPLSTLTCSSHMPYRVSPFMRRTMSTATPTTESDSRPVFFFDIDNCVSDSTGVYLCDCALIWAHTIALLQRSANATPLSIENDRILTPAQNATSSATCKNS